MATATQDPTLITDEDCRTADTVLKIVKATTAMAHNQDSAVLSPVMNLQVAMTRLKEFQEFVKGYLVEGEDYGKIPGISKPSLFKPGAEKLCELYGLADTYPEDRTRRIENWETGLFFYEFTCVLVRRGTEPALAVTEGKGSCSTYESRYRFRDASRKCPQCSQAAIIKGKDEFGGGWLCFKKKGGCGQKWQDGDPIIEKQEIGKVENENLFDLMNTVLKMAKKRAKIDAVIAATRSSGIFTQDVEDTKAAASKEEEKSTEPPTETLTGVLEDPKFQKEDLWMKVAGQATVVRKPKKEIIERLGGLHGEHVELLVEKWTGAGSKTFFVVKGILSVGLPTQESQEVIPW